MRKLDKKLMETTLQSLLLPGEGYFGAVYAGFGRGSVLSTSALDNLGRRMSSHAASSTLHLCIG